MPDTETEYDSKRCICHVRVPAINTRNKNTADSVGITLT